jgi:AcrR family transcriptional regulator
VSADRKSTPPSQPPGKRARRSAEVARREILDAAERQLQTAGPASIRLQDLAREIGVSHPTILHHFGSREELVKAVVDRSLEQLSQTVVAALANYQEGDAASLIDLVFATLGDRGHARLMAWLLLSGDIDPSGPPYLEQAARVCHGMREADHAERGLAPPRYDDTVNVLLLAALAAFADGVAGPEMRRSAGLTDDLPTRRAFRGWLADRLVELLERNP